MVIPKCPCSSLYDLENIDMQIYTLQFPNIAIQHRSHFLDFTQREVVELALRHQEKFAMRGLSADYFHKDSHRQGFVPIRIHAMCKDGMFTLRAYGEEAGESLRFWLILFVDTYPLYADHIIEHLEHWQLRHSEQPLHYKSENWIPFNRCAEKNGIFFDKQYPQNIDKDVLASRLIGNLRTFLTVTGVDTAIEMKLKLDKYPRYAHHTMALKTRTGGKKHPVYKKSFTICFSSNLVLPVCFSLGQNTAYGNGLFIRD